MKFYTIKKLKKEHIILFFCAFYVLFYFVICTDIPFGDDFWFLKNVNDFYSASTFTEKARVIISQFNLGLNYSNSIDYIEHRHVLQNILMNADVLLTHKIHIQFYLFLNLIVLLIQYFIIYLLFNKELEDKTIFTISFLILFTLVNYLNITWFSSLPNNLFLSFGLLSIYYNSRRQYFQSILFLLLSILSSYGGFIFCAVNIIYLFLRCNKKLYYYFAFTILTFIIYKQGIISTKSNSFFDLLKYSWFIVWLFLCSLGSIGLHVIPATLIGLFYIVLFFIFLKKKIYQNHPLLFSLVIFIFISCFMLTFKRCNLGFSYILNTRFRQFSMILTVLYLISFSIYFPLNFQKLKSKLLVISILYFTIGNTFSIYYAYDRKIAILEGANRYNRNKTGLFIYKGIYENENTKITEVNTIMKKLESNGFYKLPK